MAKQKLSFSQKLGYGLGDTASSILYQASFYARIDKGSGPMDLTNP